MAELVSRTEARTLTAAYRELSSSTMATILRATAGPPTYRNAADAFLGLKARTPGTEKTFAKKGARKKRKKCLQVLLIYRNVQPRLPQWCGLYRSGAG